MLSAGELIWASCRPLIRLVICVSCGFGITKADIFPAVAAQGAGQILLNITLPCLMFSKIIPAFTLDNIRALGPLILVAFIYEFLGMLMALGIKQFFWVPHRFRYGIVVAGGWANVGDIPTSVLMSLTGAAPFNGTSDQTLAVAYVSAFILVFCVTLFPCGGHKLIAYDYVGPEVGDEEVKENMRLKRKVIMRGAWIKRTVDDTLSLLGWKSTDEHGLKDIESSSHKDEKNPAATQIREEKRPRSDMPPRSAFGHSKHVSFALDDATIADATETRVASPALTVTQVDTLPENIQTKAESTPRISPPTRSCRILRSIFAFLHSLCNPPSISIILALIISLAPPLKALFVAGVPGIHIHPAPDSLPPLNFLIDTASFIGAASIPLGLVCLGSALARLRVPKSQWGQLPVGAITSFAIGKILVTPLIGVLICQGLTNVGVIDKDDKVLRFACIFFSCLPTATTQVYLTQVYSGTGNAEHLSAFLIPQYLLMFISMTGLTSFSLRLLF